MPDDCELNLICMPQFTVRKDIINIIKTAQIEHRDDIVEHYIKRPGFSPENLTLRDRLIVPEKTVPIILSKLHRHLGPRREYQYYKNLGIHWDRMSNDILIYSQSCQYCSRLRKPVNIENVPICPRIPTEPFKGLSLDIYNVGLGSEAKYCLGLICTYSKFILLDEIKSTKMVDVLEVFAVWALEYNLHTCSIQVDNAFRTLEFQEFCNLQNILLRFGIPANSRSNSLIERTFKSLTEKMRVYFSDNHALSFRLQLKFCQMLFNIEPIEGTQLCAFELIYGRTPEGALLEELPHVVASILQGFSRKLYGRLKQLYSLMSEHYLSKNPPLYNAPQTRLLNVGDQVRVVVQRRAGQTKCEYLPLSKEIYTISQVRTPTRSYVLELERAGYRTVKFLCHHRRLKKVFNRPPRLTLDITPIANKPNNGSKVKAKNQTVKPSNTDVLMPIQSTKQTRYGRTSKAPRRFDL